MSGWLPSAPCPCGSGRSYKRCCAAYHRGKPAPSPEALMRSRYSAYATGAIDYVIATTDPDGPVHRADREAWTAELVEFAAQTRFERLTVEFAQTNSCENNGENTGEVRFTAKLSRGGNDVSFTEHSRFTRVGGRWLYHSGVVRDV